MKRFLLSACLLSYVFSVPALAQAPLPAVASKAGEVTSRPFCGMLVNRSSVSMRGTVATMAQTLPDGTQARHTINYKLAPGEKKQICASGPFYEGRKLELTIRSLIPLFSCMTRMEGDVYLDMKEDSEGVKRYSATCY